MRRTANRLASATGCARCERLNALRPFIPQLSKSTYHPGFDRLCREVAAARTEANDNVKYLAPLSKYFDKLNMADDFQARPQTLAAKLSSSCRCVCSGAPQ